MHKLRRWLVELLEWVERNPGHADEIADHIWKVLKGGDATTPPDTGT
jgi:hypothetical protein